jgi:hypothetical protein
MLDVSILSSAAAAALLDALAPSVRTATYSDAKVANRDFGWEMTHAARVRDARRFPSTRLYPVPRATRTTLGFGM